MSTTNPTGFIFLAILTHHAVRSDQFRLKNFQKFIQLWFKIGSSLGLVVVECLLLFFYSMYYV